MELQRHYEQHAIAIRNDLPRVEAHFREMRFDRRYWEALRRYHFRLGVDAFWRLARLHRNDIEKLLAALKEESLPRDSTRARLGRMRTQQDAIEAAALRAEISRLDAYLRERKFDQRHWDSLRYYHDRLGMETFWRLAREHQEFEEFRLALSRELRLELLIAMEDPAEARSAPEQKAPAVSGLIEISPTDYKRGKTTDDSQ
jgi:hypothetical protein